MSTRGQTSSSFISVSWKNNKRCIGYTTGKTITSTSDTQVRHGDLVLRCDKVLLQCFSEEFPHLWGDHLSFQPGSYADEGGAINNYIGAADVQRARAGRLQHMAAGRICAIDRFAGWQILDGKVLLLEQLCYARLTTSSWGMTPSHRQHPLETGSAI